MQTTIPETTFVILSRMYKLYYHISDGKIDFRSLYILHRKLKLKEQKLRVNAHMIGLEHKEDLYDEQYLHDNIELTVNIEFYYNSSFKLYHRIYVKEFGKELINPDEFDILLKDIPTTKNICRCGKLVMIEDKCENCFIFNHTNKDQCCICYEYDGQWVQLKCRHIFHSSCIKQLKYTFVLEPHARFVLQCPLCRTPVSIIDNYYPFQSK